MPTTRSTPRCERARLRLVGPAAVDGQHAGPELPAGGGEVAGDLHRQLAGRGDHERLRRRALGRRQVELVEQRNAEAEGLAGAGAGLADQVVAGQRDRQRQFLDREGACDAHASSAETISGRMGKSENAGLSGRTGARAASGMTSSGLVVGSSGCGRLAWWFGHERPCVEQVEQSCADLPENVRAAN